MSVKRAVEILRQGGVIAYPTEGVFGLGCLPDRLQSVQRLLNIKQRDPAKGLILIAADATLFASWIRLADGEAIPDADAKRPVTWIVPANNRVDYLIRGDNDGIAVRITTNTVAKAISARLASPIVSTSANLSGQAVAANPEELQRQFCERVDYIVPGECGSSNAPSEIRILATGRILRPG